MLVLPTVTQPTGSTASAAFAELVGDLTEAVTGVGSPLAAALQQELGATLDKGAFVAPTTFSYAEVKVSTNAPTPGPAVCPEPHPSPNHQKDAMI